MATKVDRLIGSSVAIRLLEEEVDAAARSDAKVLITGETGVGKEVAARLVHERSARARASLITVNCAGVPETLLESELFGHVRGSFTGAYRDKSGLLELAHHGSIFMDEIGEMSLRMQAMLLRFLETGEIQRVGSERANAQVDVRVIAATNRNLAERIASKEFREDLYYRLNVIELAIPPLRDRREDIPLLARYFLAAYAERHHVPILELSADAMKQFTAYDWPGNVRELKNVMERLVVLGRTGHPGPADLPLGSSRILHSASVAPTPTVAARADVLFDQLVSGGQSFWAVVYEPFMCRDLTREDLRNVISRGLEQTHGSYKLLVELFNMEPGEYKRFLNFLRKHQCHMPFRSFRVSEKAALRAGGHHTSRSSAAS